MWCSFYRIFALYRNAPKSALEASHEIIAKFTQYSMDLYNKMGWKNNDLSEYYAEDFKDLTLNDFEGLPATLRRNLRNTLRENGVYIPKGRSTKIAQALYQVVQEDLAWPADDPDRPSRHNQKPSNKICFVCKQKGCWSTNHSTVERIKALRKNKQIRQFLTSIEREEETDSEVRSVEGNPVRKER